MHLHLAPNHRHFCHQELLKEILGDIERYMGLENPSNEKITKKSVLANLSEIINDSKHIKWGTEDFFR